MAGVYTGGFREPACDRNSSEEGVCVPHLGVIVSSTRTGRAGLAIADWFVELAVKDGRFDVRMLDLKAIDLPMLEEPNHPRLGHYTNPKTEEWSTLVSAMDAFVFVTPEYNHGCPPALLNALDHLFVEWQYKAAGFISYGGVSGGTRSVHMIRPVLTILKLVSIPEVVNIPFFSQYMDKQSGKFLAIEAHQKAAELMLTELLRWSSALAVLRHKPSA
jgi:NAD(P)H-dependent FMN reductase